MKELEDYNWFPAVLRRWQMEFIGHMVIWTHLYKPLVPEVQQLVTAAAVTELHDVCSGSGIPAIYIYKRLTSSLPLLLTDKYPDTGFKNIPGITYSLLPADCNGIEPQSHVCYTLFNAFHHLSPTQQQGFIQRLVKNKAPFVIAEILEPGLVNLLKIIFTATIVQLFTAPFIKPFSIARLFFTYIIPVNIVTVTYDGIISVLKSKRAAEYALRFNSLANASFAVTVNTINGWTGNIVYLKGQPKKI